ncbi:extensin-like [Iris pallida]|uniref:Extensin-like n=1 Tax=Iris pallida TaxID=29817 RepID=A0AAX6EPH9_IRIPA|nr:extensin-like [Iris pallida]
MGTPTRVDDEDEGLDCRRGQCNSGNTGSQLRDLEAELAAALVRASSTWESWTGGGSELRRAAGSSRWRSDTDDERWRSVEEREDKEKVYGGERKQCIGKRVSELTYIELCVLYNKIISCVCVEEWQKCK